MNEDRRSNESFIMYAERLHRERDEARAALAAARQLASYWQSSHQDDAMYGQWLENVLNHPRLVVGSPSSGGLPSGADTDA